MDSAMLAGCFAFVLVSLLVYGMSAWPFIAMRSLGVLKVFRTALLAGPLPALLVGIIGSRKAGLAGACGFVAGAMTAAVFFYLRIGSVFLEANSGHIAQPQYPEFISWAGALGFVALCLGLAIVVVPKRELDVDAPFSQ